jgi:hypothetical protein
MDTTEEKIEISSNLLPTLQKQEGRDPVSGRFLPGNKIREGQNWRTKTTLFREGLKAIAKKTQKDEDSVEVNIFSRAILEASNGNFAYFKIIIDMIYGGVSENPTVINQNFGNITNTKIDSSTMDPVVLKAVMERREKNG